MFYLTWTIIIAFNTFLRVTKFWTFSHILLSAINLGQCISLYNNFRSMYRNWKPKVNLTHVCRPKGLVYYNAHNGIVFIILSHSLSNIVSDARTHRITYTNTKAHWQGHTHSNTNTDIYVYAFGEDYIYCKSLSTTPFGNVC